MPGHIDDVIDASQNSEVAVHGQHRSVRRKIWPVMPVLAAGILAVFLVVLRYEAVAIAPNGLHDSGPRIANANVSRLARAGMHFRSRFVDDDGINPWHTGASASRLHGIKRRFRAAQEASVFGLPPGVTNHRLAFADCVVIPTPNLRLNRLAHRSHMFEMVVVLGRFIGTSFA